MRTRIYPVILCGLLVMGNGCADLEIPNPNNPETERVRATPDPGQDFLFRAAETRRAISPTFFDPGQFHDPVDGWPFSETFILLKFKLQLVLTTPAG